ncbi:unnamed protein product [Darwinula stevensoni]|uniref:Cathepsin O n=1 Tax=Darwinula stevensoni TaxID=69355 RepID=A0A7R8X9V3_9CRUS|nr:unnamed protein product [Darwinula stevensoni]CAG0884886.1 unnamed protein product [Darwinula stevensoni]
MEPPRGQDLVFIILMVLFCFVGIPISVKKGDNGVIANHEETFQDFMVKHGKLYKKGSSEYNNRLKNFEESLKRIQNQNNRRTSTRDAVYGITPFSDLSPDEFTKRHLLKYQPRQNLGKPPQLLKAIKTPEKFDWREKNVITAIKDQGNCGACWAFSIVECIETMNAIHGAPLQSLSVQQIIDCAENGNQGCAGGNTCTALNWLVETNTPVVSEGKYPLTLLDGKCQLPKPKTGIRVASNFTCKNFEGQEDGILELLASHGPVAVAVDGTSWQDYLGGIIQYHCESNLNHAVQIVGYDKTGDVPYYIVRNSWGTKFGLDGYLHIAIGSNQCGIALEVASLDVLP